MKFGKPKSRKIQTDHLPGPIATSYRRIFTRHDPDVERLVFVLDTAEITADSLLRSSSAPCLSWGSRGRLRRR